jgi:hypothetical protein
MTKIGLFLLKAVGLGVGTVALFFGIVFLQLVLALYLPMLFPFDALDFIKFEPR